MGWRERSVGEVMRMMRTMVMVMTMVSMVGLFIFPDWNMNGVARTRDARHGD